jgi:transcriptional regulator with XRE-family HTH domain
MSNLIQCVEAERRRRHETQAEVARALGCSLRAYAGWLSGAKSPLPVFEQRLVGYLGGTLPGPQRVDEPEGEDVPPEVRAGGVMAVLEWRRAQGRRGGEGGAREAPVASLSLRTR